MVFGLSRGVSFNFSYPSVTACVWRSPEHYGSWPSVILKVRARPRVCSVQTVRELKHGEPRCWSAWREGMLVWGWDREPVHLSPSQAAWAGEQALDLKLRLGHMGDFWFLGFWECMPQEFADWRVDYKIIFKSLQASVGYSFSPGLLHSFSCYVFMNECTYSWITKPTGVLILLLYSYIPTKLGVSQRQGPGVIVSSSFRTMFGGQMCFLNEWMKERRYSCLFYPYTFSIHIPFFSYPRTVYCIS